jgi:uncharacterized protein DUF2330
MGRGREASGSLQRARVLLGGALGLGLWPSDALACGGCFSPPSVSAPVVGHRMAFAISGERTVLWDQFEYQGAPEEFSWVLPVAPGAYLEESSAAWFAALEAHTRVQVLPPPLSCAPPRRDSGCFGSTANDNGNFSDTDSAGAFFGPSVVVLDRQTVGPYETVTLRSISGDALTEWLVSNGYVVPADIAPIIEAYVREGADFIALRLSPDVGVQQMTPVRVVTPQGPAILPLRMVAAGVGLSVDIVLFTIGDARFSLPDFAEVGLELEKLSYDFGAASSNYLELRRRALARNDGSTFLTTFAVPGGLGASDGSFTATSNGNGFADDFASLYFAQGLENDGDEDVQRCDHVVEPVQSGRRVVRVCEDAEGSDCVAEPGPGELASSELECGGLDDLEAALIGQVPSQTWLTRLELNLPRAALSADCVVERNIDQGRLSNTITARRAENAPCPQASLSTAKPRRLGEWLLGGAALLAVLRRVGLGRAGARRRSRPSSRHFWL